MRPLITREAAGLDRPPVRIVHLGLGAFHRAHQAWYTAQASDAAEWGIAAFTGRSPAAARALAPQSGVYTLVVRDAGGDRTQVIGSLVEAHDGAAVDVLAQLLSRPEVAVVTTTVTERGYRLRWDGSLDLDDEDLMLDLVAVRDGAGSPATLLGRLLLGLEARRGADAGGIAIVPCDNIPDNGAFLRRGILESAERVDPSLRDWIAEHVSFVSTSVDRITPRADARELAALLADAPFEDRAPVVTEPHTDWVLSGSFPAGRPRWEDAGARFVDEIEPWERRKLWMLNGAHTLLALLGPERGHSTVAEAIGDPILLSLVERLWQEASAHLDAAVDAADYAVRLLARFRNPRIEHRLDQIAQDSTAKIRLRIAPIAEAERRAGRLPHACATILAAWLDQQGAVQEASALSTISSALATDAVLVEHLRDLRTPAKDSLSSQISAIG